MNEKITEVKSTINTATQNKVDELKKEAEAAIKNTINSIVSKFRSWPRK